MPEKTLLDSFWAAARRLRRLSREALAPWDISPSQSRALAVLMRHGDMRLGELSAHLHIAARSVTEVADGLQDLGLIERRPDPADRRARTVGLTAKGEDLGRAVRAAQAEQAEQIFEVLTDAERAELARILGKLAGTGS